MINQPQQAEGIIASGQADFVMLARGFMYNPRWAWHAAEELGVDIPTLPSTHEPHRRNGPGPFRAAGRARPRRSLIRARSDRNRLCQCENRIGTVISFIRWRVTPPKMIS